jgi:hypothetical protein
MAKRYQRGNENPLIEGQTKQWPKDTKGESESGYRGTDKAMLNDICLHMFDTPVHMNTAHDS